MTQSRHSASARDWRDEGRRENAMQPVRAAMMGWMSEQDISLRGSRALRRGRYRRHIRADSAQDEKRCEWSPRQIKETGMNSENVEMQNVEVSHLSDDELDAAVGGFSETHGGVHFQHFCRHVVMTERKPCGKFRRG